jgi:cytochrome b
LQQSESSEPARRSAPAVGVWDRPNRVFHWALALSFLVAWFTPNAYDTSHRVAGYTVLALLAFRLVWGFVGSRYSRFASFSRLLRAVPAYLWNLRRGETGRYLGLNPAGAAMAAVLLVVLSISAVTRWMSVTVRFFGVPWVEETHRWSSNLALAFVIVHVLGVLIVSVMQKENLVRAMIDGRKRRRD